MRLIDADAMVQRLEERLKEVGKECAHLPGDSIEGLDILIDHLMLDSEIRTLREWINKQPTIEAELVRRGRWVLEDIPYTECYRITCSECGEDVTSTAPYFGGVMWDYCPNCGAKMED